MKKLLSLIFTAAIVFTLTAPTFAQETTTSQDTKTETTTTTLGVCQTLFVQESTRIRKFIQENEDRPSEAFKVVDCSAQSESA